MILGTFLRRHPEAQVTAKMGLSGRILPRIPTSAFRLARRGMRLIRAARELIVAPQRSIDSDNIEPSTAKGVEALNPADLRRSLNGSLQRLHSESVSILLLHEANCLVANQPSTVELMQLLQQQGIFKKGGVGGGAPLSEQVGLHPIYEVIQTEFHLGGRSWPRDAVAAPREKILYAALRPLRAITSRLVESGQLGKWRRELDSSLEGDESLAVWLMSWALHELPNSRAVFYSANPKHIREMTRGVRSLMVDSQRLTVLSSLYRRLVT
jgi:aryl-alcohol dehydrogenase-like predicted oxidoreductase